MFFVTANLAVFPVFDVVSLAEIRCDVHRLHVVGQSLSRTRPMEIRPVSLKLRTFGSLSPENSEHMISHMEKRCPNSWGRGSKLEIVAQNSYLNCTNKTDNWFTRILTQDYPASLKFEPAVPAATTFAMPLFPVLDPNGLVIFSIKELITTLRYLD